MSYNAGPNPFSSMGAARPKQPSIVPKILAVIAALIIVSIVVIVVVNRMGVVGGGLTHGLYHKEVVGKFTAKELWKTFKDDREESTEKYKGRLIVVTGDCSAPLASRPDGSALNEEYDVKLGRKARRFGDEEWLVYCRIPRANWNAFGEVKAGDVLTIRARCEGMPGDDQVVLEDCTLVSKE